MEAESAARQAIQRAEKAKQELIDEAAEMGITITAGTFNELNVFLEQAKLAFTAGNYQKVKRLVE